MAEELTLEMLQSIAESHGLTLPLDELQKLLPGVRRARKQAAELRDLVTSANEPAGVFDVHNRDGK